MPTARLMFGALVLSFLVYLAIKGRLGAYWSLLTGGAPVSSSGGIAQAATQAATAVIDTGGAG
jgi:hypothetical protein